jgi:phage-related tail protein
MPVTKSEMMFFAAGAALGAAAGANFPLLKEKFGPILAAALAGASSAVGDSYADLAKTVAEKVEAVQDAMAEMKETAASRDATEVPSV